MFGQLGHFYKFAKGKTDSYGEDRYGAETKRLLGVLDKQLDGRDWIIGEYSIADIAIAPWVGALDYYEAKEFVDYDSFDNVKAWMARFLDRPGVQRGMKVLPF